MAVWRHKKGWRYQFQVGGTRYAKAGFPTRAEALAAQEDHKKEVKAGKVQKTPSGMGFRTVSYEYLDWVQRRYSEKTYKEKVFVYKSFMESVGNLPVAQISAKIVESYLLTRPTNPNYNKHRKNLCAFFEWAFKRALLDKNPCIYIGSMPHLRAGKQIPSQEEVVKLILASGELRPFFVALYSLVGRVNEINRLRWDDINFERRQIILWTRKGDGTYRAQVKPLNDELSKELRGLHSKRSGEWVFPNPRTGLPFVDRRKQLRRICRSAGVDVCGFHAIRHHVASLLADRFKVSLPTIQKMLGHSRLTTTDRYIQSLGNGVREASDLLQIFTSKRDPLTCLPHQNKKGSGD
jgi:integrase